MENEATKDVPESEQGDAAVIKERPYVIAAYQEYEDSNGRRIREQVPVAGDVPTDYVRFCGYAVYRIKVGANVVEAKAELPIYAENIVEAFGKFDEIAKETEPTVRKQVMQQLRAEQQQVVVAGAMPPGGGNGKRLIT